LRRNVVTQACWLLYLRRLCVVKRDLSLGREGARALLPEPQSEDHTSDIVELLGRLHNQKEFYRPSGSPYVSG